jgi:HlyD family secretion protein
MAVLAGCSHVDEVRTATVLPADLISTVSTNGKVLPIEDFQAHSPLSTLVKKVYVHVGSQVAAGQELIRLDDGDAIRQVAAAQSTLASAQASLDNMRLGGTSEERLNSSADLTAARTDERNAAATLSSTQALSRQGAASASEVAAAQQRVNSDQARITQLQGRQAGRYSATDLAAQQAAVNEARAALSAAQAALAGVDIRAPFAGTVYALNVSDYNFVPAGDLLLGLADLTKIRVHAYFDEPEIGKLAVGQPVKIVWDARPNLQWHGHILQVPSTVISYGTRNVGEALISVDDARGDLLPNTNVTATVTTAQKFNVLSVPREALHTDGPHNFVFAILNGHLHKTSVEVGTVNLTRVEIVSGLKQGDVVAVSLTGEGSLRDGAAVKAAP